MGLAPGKIQADRSGGPNFEDAESCLWCWPASMIRRTREQHLKPSSSCEREGMFQELLVVLCAMAQAVRARRDRGWGFLLWAPQSP